MFELVLQQIAVIAVFVERLVNFVKLIKYSEWAVAYEKYIDVGLSLIANMGLCFVWKVDLFAVAGLGIPAAPWAGSLLTGLFAGVGSGVFHELVELLKLWRAGVPRA